MSRNNLSCAIYGASLAPHLPQLGTAASPLTAAFPMMLPHLAHYRALTSLCRAHTPDVATLYLVPLYHFKHTIGGSDGHPVVKLRLEPKTVPAHCCPVLAMLLQLKTVLTWWRCGSNPRRCQRTAALCIPLCSPLSPLSPLSPNPVPAGGAAARTQDRARALRGSLRSTVLTTVATVS